MIRNRECVGCTARKLRIDSVRQDSELNGFWVPQTVNFWKCPRTRTMVSGKIRPTRVPSEVVRVLLVWCIGWWRTVKKKVTRYIIYTRFRAKHQIEVIRCSILAICPPSSYLSEKVLSRGLPITLLFLVVSHPSFSTYYCLFHISLSQITLNDIFQLVAQISHECH